MRNIFTSTFIIVIMVLIMIPSYSFAQSGTLMVYANGPTIDQVINGDVTDGVQNHSVYQLVSLDTTYLLDATITSQSSISIIGTPDPSTDKLPCIEADVLSDNSIPGIFFTFTGQGTRVKLQNLYLLGIAPNNSVNTAFGQGVQISADSISLTIDNCVFEEFSQFGIAFSSNWNKFYITNSKFRNGIEVATAYYVPEMLRSLNGAGAWSTDTIFIKYNTLLGIAMGPVVTTGITNYFEFSNNDVLLSSKAALWSEQVVNAKFNNNIFYDVYATGESETEYAGGWDEINPPRIPAIFSFHNLDSTKAALFLGHPITSSANSMEAETSRSVEVMNNVYYWSSGLNSFWTSWNDTATVTSIYTPVFMNDETVNMFSNKTMWPGFIESGNQNVDPGFGPTLNTALDPGSEGDYGVGLLAWVAAVRGGTGTTERYSYQRTNVGSTTDWTPDWPLPESADLQYSNASLKTGATDGGYVGDPYWFVGVTGVEKVPGITPDKFTLYEAYPNPFNPSTTIRFSIPESGNVTLKVYNITGQEVMTVLDNEFKANGSYDVNVDMSNLSSGVYFYTLRQNSSFLTKKMILLK